MKKLKVAIVGNGNIFNNAHVKTWKYIKDVEITATCDIIPNRAERASKVLGASKYFTIMDDLLSDDDIDIIDLCIPTYEHANLSIAALKAGKHVICEKPMARTLKDAKEMINVSNKNGSELYIGHTRRFDKRWKTIFENLNSGKIGKPVHLHRSERSWLPFPADSWYWDSDKSGGVLLDMGVHCVDIAKWFFNSKVKEVFAKGQMIRNEAKQKNTTDQVAIMLNFEDDKTALIDVSWAFPKTYAPFYCSMDIVGTKGRIEYSDKNTKPMISVKDGIEYPRYSPLLSSDLNSFKAEFEEFIRCINNGNEPLITKNEAYEILKIVLGAEDSMQKHKPVRF